ncbi:hypothetical protein ACFL5J_01625 [Thermodesulfobacteriota bacterium]
MAEEQTTLLNDDLYHNKHPGIIVFDINGTSGVERVRLDEAIDQLNGV